MRRLILALAITTAVAVAPAALAQERDPFQPLIQEDTGGSVPDAGTGDGPEVIAPVAPNPDEPLPQTGADPSSYLGIAFLLITLGAMALLLARINSGPVKVRSGPR